MAVGVGDVVPGAVLGAFALGMEGAAAGVAAAAGVGAAYVDAGQAAAALSVVGAGVYAELQICHSDTLHFCGFFHRRSMRRMVTGIVCPPPKDLSFERNDFCKARRKIFYGLANKKSLKIKFNG